MSIGKIIIYVLLAAFGLSIFSYAMGWIGEAAEVAQDEFGPKVALEKYEWFIDRAEDIKKMNRDVQLFEKRVQQVDSTYLAYGEKTEWGLDIRVMYNNEKKQAQSDLIAMKSQRNGLVREYNAASDKFNWKPFQTKPDKPRERYFELE